MREADDLDGLMGRVVDAAGIQVRALKLFEGRPYLVRARRPTAGSIVRR